MIPEAAVEAAFGSYVGGNEVSGPDIAGDYLTREQLRTILEAAAPIMRQAFYLEMNLRAVQDELARPLFPLGKIEDKRRNGND